MMPMGYEFYDSLSCWSQSPKWFGSGTKSLCQDNCALFHQVLAKDATTWKLNRFCDSLNPCYGQFPKLKDGEKKNQFLIESLQCTSKAS